jgi:hypothetical protein
MAQVMWVAESLRDKSLLDEVKNILPFDKGKARKGRLAKRQAQRENKYE